MLFDDYICILLYSLIHSVTKNLSEHRDKLDEETAKEVQAALDAAQAVTSSDDLEVVKAKKEALSTASMKIGQAMYKNKGGDGAAPADGADTAKDAKDADFEEKEKK